MLDKQRFAGACTAAGVKAPRTWTDDMPLEALREMRAPLLVKPKLKSDWQKLKLAFFRGGAKAMRFESAGDLLDHPAFELVRDSVVVQELIESPVAALSSFHGFADASGRLLASFCGRKVRTSPAFAGESAVIELVRDDEVERAGRDTVARLGVVGPFKVDLVRDPRTGELFTLEVNARFNLWHHLGAAHGVNLPAIAYHHLVEGRDEAPLDEVVPRARWVSFYGCYRALRDEGRGPVGALARWAATALRSSVVHDVLDWRDPAPFLWYVRSLARPRRRGPAVVAAAAPL
jgi:predicted ATP-grasp superfamily ATP-dependent carboligase